MRKASSSKFTSICIYTRAEADGALHSKLPSIPLRRLGMMGGDPCKAARASRGLRQGEEDDVVGIGGGDGRASETAAGMDSGVVSSGSLCSSSLTDDDDDDDGDGDATSPPEDDCKSSSSSSSDAMQLDGDGADGGPLYELAPLLAHLPVRTGLSKYYQGRSQSFTSLSHAKCVEDLAKKTVPYNSRMEECRGYAAAGLGANRSSNSRYVPGPRSKTIAKKTPRGSSDRLLSRVTSTSLLHGSGKPPAYQSKKDLYRY